MLKNDLFFFFFVCNCSGFSAPFVEETVFLTLCSLVSFVIDGLMMGMVYLWALYCPTHVCFCFVPENASFAACSSVVCLKLGLDPPCSICSISLLQDCFGFWVLCVSVQIFRDFFFLF